MSILRLINYENEEELLPLFIFSDKTWIYLRGER